MLSGSAIVIIIYTADLVTLAETLLLLKKRLKKMKNHDSEVCVRCTT